ncbi:hypothetical protein Pfo_028942 [Paulownia fortunei]|nr:hypothetical protein Pfo_028942 [Paulownia fortunei]
MGFPVPSFSSFWNSYLMRLFPGWPDHQTLCDYCFSLLLVFLLTFTAEFCSKYPISPQNDRRLAALSGAALRALKMFMTYLAIIAIMATDFVFFLVAVGGHAVGSFVAGLYQYHIEQAESTLYNGCGVAVCRVAWQRPPRDLYTSPGDGVRAGGWGTNLVVAPSLKPRGLTPAAGALIHAVVFGARMALAYLIMLSVMSFNLGVFVVAVAGHAVGCFIVKYRVLAAAARAVDSSPKF